VLWFVTNEEDQFALVITSNVAPDSAEDSQIKSPPVPFSDENGEWVETTQVSLGSSPPRTSVEMRLRRVSLAADRFDGKWLTTVSCEAARDALGYSFRFVSEIKDGNLR
jgi:hypothetical protein